jgi:DNA-binding XRE family transcriptional regulator
MSKKSIKEQDVQTECDHVVNDLRTLRENSNITTYQLAEIIGCFQSNIVRIETGGTTPNLKTVISIAKALGAEIKVVGKSQK